MKAKPQSNHCELQSLTLTIVLDRDLHGLPPTTAHLLSMPDSTEIISVEQKPLLYY